MNVFIKPKDIADGNKKLNISLVAQLFNTCHGLVYESETVPDLSTLEIDDVGDSREERVFRMWINSLNIEGVYVNNLFADSGDGVLLLKVSYALHHVPRAPYTIPYTTSPYNIHHKPYTIQVIDYVVPGKINWRRVNMDPVSRFKKVENANLVIEVCKSLSLTMVNIGMSWLVMGCEFWRIVCVHFVYAYVYVYGPLLTHTRTNTHILL